MCLVTNCAFHKDRDNDFVSFAFCLFQSVQRQLLVDCWRVVAVVVKGRERGQGGGIINSFNKKLLHITAKISQTFMSSTVQGELHYLI